MADITLSGITAERGAFRPRYMDIQGESHSVPFPIRLGKNGGIGFQFEAGVIVVTALADRVNVQADRPFSSLGSHVHAPPGSLYDIGTPSLTVQATLDIPIVVTASLDLVALTPLNGYLSLEFSAALGLTQGGTELGSYWFTTTTPGATLPTIYRIEVVNNLLNLYVNGQTIGANYVLHFAPGIIYNPSNGGIWMGTSIPFVGVDDPPHVVAAYAETGTSFILIFNEEVDEVSATTISNYAINPQLEILSITRVNTLSYRVHCGQQIAGQVYNVTLTGIIDRVRNPI